MSYLSTSNYTARKKVQGQNNTNGLDLDDDVSQDLVGHGICIGITGSWVIGLLSGAEGAVAKDKFKAYLQNFLRHQGAYIKFAHNISPGERINNLMGSMGIGSLANKSEHKKRNTFLNLFPADDLTWAAHLAIHHHDIGCGHVAGDNYYIMDPNHGLYIYANHSDMQTVLESYRAASKLKRGTQYKSCTAWI